MGTKLHVSRSGYYEWRDRPESATANRREELRVLISKIFEDSDSRDGYRRVHAQLRRWDVQAGAELVRQLMRELGLVPCQPKPKRFSLTKVGLPFPVPDLVARNFTADRPGEKMVGDITYIPTGEGWLYLATVIDCCTRNAARNRKLAKKAIFHSDRGSNYMSAEYGKTLDQLDLRRSAGRTGICYERRGAGALFAARFAGAGTRPAGCPRW
ncbi:IS3 family transposase [Streptomyces sp. H10-C2]|uniref:IS3 family transposase n=1 Tax=unclassified Streptomyces TaxID=2593676 RepID=UPI0024BA13B9|nr:MULTISPECIES: IS3 family transposase [unclassified Streptomyces]MDJ0341208.1 IS3 family transposase [Streptomyces sp. PH10-H1]MDJ0369439.1 IS3 family transposase [Streptomyces sp. H10-C2]